MEGLYNRVADTGTKAAVMRLEQMIDALQKASGSASTAAPITDHNQLNGLTAGNDHPQYQMTVSGMIVAYGGSVAPGGWVLCDGSAVSRIAYSALFGVLGTVYGVGDGSTTFNVPDLRSRVPVGAGNGPIYSYPMGLAFGSEQRTLTTTELPNHSHSATQGAHNHTATTTIDPHHHSFVNAPLVYTSSPAGLYGNAAGSTCSFVDQIGGASLYTGSTTATASTTIGNTTPGISVSSTGSGAAFDIMQRSLVVNYIIKT